MLKIDRLIKNSRFFKFILHYTHVCTEYTRYVYVFLQIDMESSKVYSIY